MSAPFTAGLNRRIDQRRIPGLNRLYADYLYDFGRVAELYNAPRPFDLEALSAAAGQVEYPAGRRQAMAALLERQNRAWAPAGRLPEATAAHLREFAAPGTVAVITGQQVGLLGGPLMGLHKAMAAVLLSEQLRSRGVPTVPVFWMATQDHDLAEIDHAWVLDAAAEPRRLQGDLGPSHEAPVGPLRLSAAITGLIEEMARCTGADAAALADVQASYRPGVTLADAFASLFARWFAPWGLIVFDPLQAPEAAAVWAPVYREVLDRQPELAQRLSARAQQLTAAGYHVQVEQTAAATMLFLHRDGARLGLRRRLDASAGSAEPLLLGERPLGLGAAQDWIAEHPDCVSPSALLRPYLQNLVFPTVAQVTGPSETAYLAQTAVLYPDLGSHPPVTHPRATATLLDPKSQRLMRKHGLDLEQIWTEPIEELLARRALPAGIDRQIGAMRTTFDREFETLTRDLKTLDPTLVDATGAAVQKIHHQLEQLETRVARSFARRSDEAGAQARYLAGHLFPRRTLQERLLSAAGWAVRYPDLLPLLHHHLDPLTPDHQVIDL
jgi:bacillithiol biosynthesis cysteine-adding enzyme BshC